MKSIRPSYMRCFNCFGTQDIKNTIILPQSLSETTRTTSVSSVMTLPVSAHLSSVVFLLCLVLLHNTGEAAGIGGRSWKVLSLGDGRRPATHHQTTHLCHSAHINACVIRIQNIHCFSFQMSNYFASCSHSSNSKSSDSSVFACGLVMG